jgi:hypothetical protein
MLMLRPVIPFSGVHSIGRRNTLTLEVFMALPNEKKHEPARQLLG